jgi:hypothetical protein
MKVHVADYLQLSDSVVSVNNYLINLRCSHEGRQVHVLLKCMRLENCLYLL